MEELAESLILESKSRRFKTHLTAFLEEAYGQKRSDLVPDLECFVNAQKDTYQKQEMKEKNNICGSIQLSPVKKGKKRGRDVTVATIPPIGNINPENCDLLLDSGAFTDWQTGYRTTPETALNRQIAAINSLGAFHKVYLASYDYLIPEKHVYGYRKKLEWCKNKGKNCVEETLVAAKYLDSQRYRLTNFTLIQGCQGVDSNQYYDCVNRILEYSQPNDVIGLGGWCPLGANRGWLPSFWETINKIIPLIAEAGIKRVHIFGVTWYKPIKGLIPPLPPLLYLCDKYGIKLSTDGRSPISNALSNNPEKANPVFPYWRHNLAWVKAELATLRDSEFYMAPPNWHWSQEPLLKLLSA